MVQYRLNIETESRIRWKVYVRFGGEHLEIAHVHMIRRRVLSLHFKFPDLSTIAYNHMMNHQNGYKVKPQFYVINFDDPRRSHRCNPIHPDFMSDISDAYESAYTIMLNLNKTWVQKQGDFFVESPIILFAAAFKSVMICSEDSVPLNESDANKTDTEAKEAAKGKKATIQIERLASKLAVTLKGDGLDITLGQFFSCALFDELEQENQ